MLHRAFMSNMASSQCDISMWSTGTDLETFWGHFPRLDKKFMVYPHCEYKW